MDRARLEPLLGKQVTLTWPDDEIALCTTCLKTLHRAKTIKNYTTPCRFCECTGITVLRSRTRQATGLLSTLTKTEAGLDTGIWVSLAAITNTVEVP